MKIIFCLCLGLFLPVHSFDLNEPGEEDVTFGDKTSSGIQLVNVIENNNATPRINIVLITDATSAPNLQFFVDTYYVDYFDLNVENGAESNSYYISSNRVDYEKLGDQTQFNMDISDGSDSQSVTIVIVNIDDEPPTLISSSPSCPMEENAHVTIDNQSCEFTISDPDGFLAQMTFPIAEQAANDVFEFVFREPKPNDSIKSASVYLILKGDYTLDYEEKTLWTFHVDAQDGAKHSTVPVASIPIIVEVIDMPDEPPRWDSTFREALTIIEKQATTIKVSATDGDVGINNEINYKIFDIKPDDLNDSITVDVSTGLITIQPINRDTGNHDIVTFIVQAYEKIDTSSSLDGSITLMVQDIDDNVAVIKVEKFDHSGIEITVDEGTTDLELVISSNDIDLGKNAMYNAILETTGKGDVNYTTAFSIIPSQGYQEISLNLAVINATLLDYEDPPWQIITFELKTIGVENSSMIDVIPVTIHLNDINDEWPIFSPVEYTAEVYENVTVGYVVAYIQATDRDPEDANLNHTLQGTLSNSILNIDGYGGNIATIKEDAFDYEKQEEVFVQIVAIDKADHKATAQLTISVLDVNDEDPKLVVSSTISVEENRPDGEEIPAVITASDVDTKPYLEFSIDWKQSYASKNSRKLSSTDFEDLHWIDVETIRDPETNNSVTAKLTIKETHKDNTPDFEVFDSMYIMLVVTDKLTEKGRGNDSVLVLISIIDINDNPPVFPADVESVLRTVVENSPTGTTITTVTATDADIGDVVTYSIKNATSDTPLWVSIDPSVGTIVVNLPSGEVLDCDDPVRYNLTYIVTATDNDEVHTTTAKITISIIDKNDNFPSMDDQGIEIEELPNGDNSKNGEVILKFTPIDKDRDEPNNVVECLFSSSTTAEATKRFNIEDNELSIQLDDGYDLDREATETISFTLNCRDDPTRQSGVSNPMDPQPVVTITLTDINDNPPTILNPDATKVDESVKSGTLNTLQGYDADFGDNGTIASADILLIQRYLNKEDETPEGNLTNDNFQLETIDDNKINLILARDDLRGLYGYLVLRVKLTDKGTPPLSQEIDVGVTVEKYNFEAPLFRTPDYDKPIYLQFQQNENAQLILFDGHTPLPNINATDQQGDKYSLRFDIVGGSGQDFFKIEMRGSLGQLQVPSNDFPKVAYNLIISASITEAVIGNAAWSTNKTIEIDFFDEANTDPVFSTHEGSTAFPENEKNLTYEIPEAKYSFDGDVPDQLSVYYLLAEGNRTLFTVDLHTGLLTLIEELDYESVTSYNVTIQSSNSPSIKPDAVEETKYYLTVDVIDVNDNPPVFYPKEYTAVIVIDTDSVNGDDVIATVEATDIDTTSQGKLRYVITDVTASDDSIKNIENPFSIGSKNGSIKPTFAKSLSYKGHFTITVTVYDEDDFNDNATVIVYLITKSNLFTFNFANDVTTVQNAKNDIKTILDGNFPDYNSNVRTPIAYNSPNDADLVTNEETYFSDRKTSEPIDNTEIKKKVTNVPFFNLLKRDFAAVGLTLMSFDADNAAKNNIEAQLEAWLIGVSVVLGALTLILLIAFILKTRSLNQRINKLSSTKFGSQESGLNRIGVAAPTTNKHAVEGSNPVYNNEVDTKDIDRKMSVTSGDSDLIGVEDDDKFNYDYPTKD